MTGVAETLGKPLCTLAFCWRLDRRDGVSIGLTSHDRPLTVAGFRYDAAPGMRPAAIRWSGGLDAAVMDVEGALTSAAISEADLVLGRWDGAAVRLDLTEWAEPGLLWLSLASGTLGPVRQSGGSFSASLAGAKALFGRSVAPLTSPTCRAALGDRDCRVDMAPLRQVVTVDAVASERMEMSGLNGEHYAYGRLRWMGGPLAGLWATIVDGGSGFVLLDEAPPVAVTAGTRVLIEQGCDRTIATCAARFGNAVNFRGEPYLPGNDLLTRYPGA